MRHNGNIMTRQRWGASSTDGSEDCSSLDDDPRIVSIHLLTESDSTDNVRKSYQGMVDMLDRDLQVICVSDKSDFPNIGENSSKKSESDTAIPCLATVLFFNGDIESENRKTSTPKTNGFSKPDLLLNHMWNKDTGLYDFDKNLHNGLDNKGSDIINGRHTPFSDVTKTSKINNKKAPFLRYDAILKESEERQKDIFKLAEERDVGFRKGIFDFETAETTLEARKQLGTWPWEFHHKAHVTKGITQCHGNAQDFYAYQPDRDVTRLYGDVIDTSKISRRRNMNARGGNQKDTFVNLLEKTTDELRDNTFLNERGGKKKTISTRDFPLMAVREVHYGRQHLRYTLFVSATTWIDQVEFYRLLLRRHEVTLRDDFCFFTIYCGENTDIQFALKKLGPNQRPAPLSSTILQFKVHKVGHLVPLLPYACKPISEVRWQTKDHDGNALLLQICPGPSASDTSSSHCEKELLPLDDAVPSSDMKHMSDHEDEYSLERLDSFIEPELPARMPLLTSSLYSNFSGRPRFGSRHTSSPSPASSSSNSPERRPRRFGNYTPKKFSSSSIEMGSTCTLPNPRNSSQSSSRTSRTSESSEEHESINFYRRAKCKMNERRKSDGAITPRPHAKRKSTSRTPKQHRNSSNTKLPEEEIVVYV